MHRARALFFVCAGALLLALAAAPALAQVELLPLGATYRYLVTPNGANPPGAEDPGFDDSGFPNGAAPFGFGSAAWISWGLSEVLTARTHLHPSGVPTGAMLNPRLNGYGSLYVNGVLVSLLENCGPINGQAIPLCDGLLHTGDNVIVAVLLANCGGAYFDVSISATTGATEAAPMDWGRLKVRYR